MSKKVFISSVRGDLDEFRAAVIKAVAELEGFETIEMEAFGARDQGAVEVCQAKVRESDIFVCILGNRYGSCPPNSELSYCELEYEAAIAKSIPRLVFPLPDNFPIPNDLIEPDSARARQRRFRDRATKDRVASNAVVDPQSLATKVVTSLANLQSKIAMAMREEYDQGVAQGRIPRIPAATVLLFQFVSNQAGFDCGIATSNLSGNHFVSPPVTGNIIIHYYGGCTGGLPAPPSQWSSSPVFPGQHAAFTLTSGGTNGIAAAPGFQGYLIVECSFPAHGIATLSDVGGSG